MFNTLEDIIAFNMKFIDDSILEQINEIRRCE